MKEITVSCSKKDAEVKPYVPSAIGNGDLSLQIDYQGIQFQETYCGMIPGIRRAGYRYDSPNYPLVPFGYFNQEFAGCGKVNDWTQSIDINNAMVHTSCEYENGTVVESEIFCHLEYNIVAIKKRIKGNIKNTEFKFSYNLGAPRRVKAIPSNDMDLSYEIDGLEQYRGSISLMSDLNIERIASCTELSMKGTFKEAVFFIVFDTDLKKIVKEQGWNGLLASHQAAWSAYWNEAYIDVPSEEIMNTYYVSQYHLRISSTKWSIPIGIFDTHWHGRYFGFDELFIFSGLVTSGHMEIAKKIPEFRYSILEKAMNRASLCWGKNAGGAKYSWETIETGDEGAPAGYWIEHIFHMANIALCAMKYYELSGDRSFLEKKGFPIIKACAEYYRLNSIYHNTDGSAIVGVHTDFERLGAHRRNTFATTCSIIATLEKASEAASLLNTEADLAAEWKATAGKLRDSLPHDGEKYIPYPGCTQRSIASFTGIFPYDVTDVNDPKQIEAIADACKHESEFANMYSGGKIVTTWYAGMMAAVAIRLGDTEKAYKLIYNTASATGCFSEIFEVYEKRMRPWFTTGEATFIHAVNEMLFNGEKIAPSVPKDWKDFSFKLQATDGKKIEAVFKDGKLCSKKFC